MRNKKTEILAVAVTILFVLPALVAAVPETYPYFAEPNIVSAITNVKQEVIDWMYLSITGGPAYEPGDSINHGIFLTAPSGVVPDLDWSDGTYAPFFGGWAVIDSKGNIVRQSDWSMLSGTTYQATATFNAPTAFGKYALVGLIVKVPQTYNTATKTWSVGTQEIITKEAAELTIAIYTEPGTARPNFIELVKSFWNWLKGLFGF